MLEVNTSGKDYIPNDNEGELVNLVKAWPEAQFPSHSILISFFAHLEVSFVPSAVCVSL